MCMFIWSCLGVQGILWCLFWSCLSYEEPSNHPNITKAELELIGKHWNTKVCTGVMHVYIHVHQLKHNNTLFIICLAVRLTDYQPDIYACVC